MNNRVVPDEERRLPVSSELFTIREMVCRHPNLLTESRVKWALRNRFKNGLDNAVFETQGGELLIEEPSFLRWFLKLDGRNKPRASSRRRLRAPASTAKAKLYNADAASR